MAEGKKKALGRGLTALITVRPEEPAPAEVPRRTESSDGDRVLYLDPKTLKPNPKQPRKAFREEALEELAASIKRDGVQEPVIVRKGKDGYELVSGERRVRASVMAGLDQIPAIRRDVSDTDMLKLGLIENIQREDLNPIELAQGFQALITEFHWTQEQLADEVGKKRVTVTNILRLLNLPPDLQQHLIDGNLSMGHARALLALPSAEAQRAAARKIITLGLSVREAERLAAPAEPKPKKSLKSKDPNIAGIEEEFQRILGTKVTIRTRKKNRGSIEIEYYSLDDFDRIMGIVRGKR